MNALTLDTKVLRNPDLVATKMDGEVVMMSIELGEYFGINSVGSRIWELLESKQSISEICKHICDEYEVDSEQCQLDVLAFTNDMLARNIVLAC
ncbi:MAG: lasso peptide biosynthesis PqqD family chaperone [Pseudomonadota bacterium]